jgi:hypothetical protein
VYHCAGRDGRAYYGDSLPQQRFCTLFGCYPTQNDMTAIVRVHTQEGFLVAADGLMTHSENPALNVENAQKIIQLDGKSRQLACCCTGISHITEDYSERVILEFLSEVRITAQRLYYRSYKDLKRYAGALAAPINEKILAIKREGKIAEYPTAKIRLEGERSSTIVDLFLDGYFNGIPSHVSIRFHHDNQYLLEPAVSDLPLGMMMIQGPPVPAILPLQQSGSAKLIEVLESARQYIEACSTPAARNAYPEMMIGGRFHAATITRGLGFQWAIPPLSDAGTVLSTP